MATGVHSHWLDLYIRTAFVKQLRQLPNANNIEKRILSLLTPTVVAWVWRSSAFVVLSVCQHDKTKTTENKIAKLGTQIFHHYITIPRPSINIRSKGQRSRPQGQKVKCKKSRRDSRAAPCRCAVTPLIETAPRGRRELCTLSSAQRPVDKRVHTVLSRLL